jgi:hypothetical protein
MDDRSWMYRDSFEGLYRKYYLKRINSFINFILSNLKNISRVKVDVCTQSVRIKSSTIKMLWLCIYLKKSLLRNTYVGLHTNNPMFVIKQY